MDGDDARNGAGPLIAVAGLAVVRALHAHRASLGRGDRWGSADARREYADALDAALWHHANGLVAEALRRYGALLQMSPNDPVVLTNAAQIWIDHGVSLQDAARALDLAVMATSDPRTRARVTIQRARLHLSFGRYSEAAAELVASVNAFPDPGADPVPTAWYLLGTCLAEMGDDTGAQRAFRTVLAHRPLVVEAWTALARLIADTDRDAACGLLEHGHTLIAPPGAGQEARQAAGDLLVEAALIRLVPPKDHDRARDLLGRAARLCPESPCPPVNQAVIDEELHDLAGFRRHIREAVSKVRRTDRRLIAHLLSGAFSSEYGSLTLAAMGEARLIDRAELRRRLDAWEHRRADRERPGSGDRHYYTGVPAGHGAVVSGAGRAYTLNGGTAMNRDR
ncbi:tetratricopeptide repeat protein [Sphaerisporangium corydalis]|uniref:Tetratricopeptide repeat protein n=1 Tax=Sphaerisporangium corydalis TaxID=1441875 RepID=A0ABV9ENS5_9ACTN|nr:tetratricopeptide repeat protein [Sphaerisporangium corydalis]